MKPDTLGDEHPLEFAVIDGLYPGADLDKQPVVTGTAGFTDVQVLDWVREDPQRAELGLMAISRLIMPGTTGCRMALVRFTRCPSCGEWSPCKVRHERGY